MGFLDGRVAVVTGGGQGIGRGIALALSDQGAAVALVGRTAAKVEAVAAEIAGRNGRSLPIQADIKQLDDVRRLVHDVVAEWGGVDVLVNNAMQYALGDLLHVDDADIDASWESGPLATFRLMRECHPHLRAGGGVVINVSSSSSVNPRPVGKPMYAALKATINSLTRVAAVEWGGDGIRVLGIMPTANSPMLDRYRETDPAVVERALEEIPLHRFADPETEIGRVVAFLCGPDATYLTGVTLPIDGGIAYLR